MGTPEVLEILKWPVAVTLIVVVLILVLRKELRTFVSNITKLKMFGHEVTTKPQELLAVRKAPETIESSAEKSASGVKENPIMIHAVETVRAQLTSVPQGEREDRLVKQLAIERLRLRFERCHRGIYTSQLNTLQYLRGREQLSAPSETVETYWEAARLRNPTYTFEAWLSFLISWDLVEKGPEGIIKITDSGLLYLETIVGLGWSLTPNSQY